jgi:hypothetical protein
MSGASIPRAVELVATLLIPKKAANPDQLREGITHWGGVVSGSRLSGHVKRAFIRGQPGKEALFSITARVRVLTDDGADILMVDRGEWRLRPCRITNLRMLDPCAPKAIRTPISRLRPHRIS